MLTNLLLYFVFNEFELSSLNFLKIDHNIIFIFSTNRLKDLNFALKVDHILFKNLKLFLI